MAFRIETGRLDKAVPTAGGGLRIPATIGRAGILVYRKSDGTEWREYRPPSEAFAGASLDSLRGAPVTDLHPGGAVTPESYQGVVRGHVGDDARKDDDGKHVAASLYVADAALIRGIEAGQRSDVSAGYDVELDHTPGMTPDGEHYDAIQTTIKYNHVAIGPPGWGRAGTTVGLRLDDNGDQVCNPPADAGPHPEERSRMKITIHVDGVDHPIEVDDGTAAALPAGLAKERAAAEATATKLADATARADAAEKERDEAKGRADSLTADAKKAADPKALGALVTARVALETQASTLKADVKCDGLTDREVMIAALDVELTDDHSDDYVRARFDADVERADAIGESRNSVRAVVTAGSGAQVSEAKAAQLAYHARNKAASKGVG